MKTIQNLLKNSKYQVIWKSHRDQQNEIQHGSIKGTFSVTEIILDIFL